MRGKHGYRVLVFNLDNQPIIPGATFYYYSRFPAGRGPVLHGVGNRLRYRKFDVGDILLREAH